MSSEVVNGDGGGGLKKNEDMVQQQLLPYLGEDIITRILLKIPAESLFNTFRYVCKSWLNIISIHTDIHLNRLLPSKSPCLIIQNVDKDEHNLTTCFFTLSKEGKIEEQFDDLNPVLNNLWIRACCNGLILASTFSNTKKDYYVVNPLTNYRVILPPPPPPCQPIALRFLTEFFEFVKFVYIPSTGEYKVIVTGFFIRNGSPPPKTKSIQILTLSAGDCYGSSSSNERLQWRLIEAPNKTFKSAPVAINGILYWDCFLYGDSIISNEREVDIVSFDASVEKFYVTTCLHCDKRESREGYLGLLEMGGLPSSWSLLLEEHDDVWRFSVHVVKDFHEGEWIEKYSVRFDTDFMKISDRYYPILSFGNGEVLIFHHEKEKTLWALNVKLNQWWKLENKNLKEHLGFCFYGFHVNNKPVPLESIFAIESGVEEEEEEDSEGDDDDDQNHEVVKMLMMMMRIMR